MTTEQILILIVLMIVGLIAIRVWRKVTGDFSLFYPTWVVLVIVCVAWSLSN